MQKNKFEEVRY